MARRHRTNQRSGIVRWAVLVVVAVTALLGAGQLASAADDTVVAQRLASLGDVVGGLTDSIGADGAYGDVPNAGAVPFLGGEPGSLVAGLFDDLDPLSQLDSFAPAGTDKVQVVEDALASVDSALGGSALLDRTYTCGAAACELGTSEVSTLTAVTMRLARGGSTSGKVDFTSLGLPSVGFLPDGAKQLDVDLSWSVDVRVRADADGISLVPDDAVHELTLGATITLPTDSFKVDVGALVVEATATTAPQFKGQLNVDVQDDGSLGFGFGDGSGFTAEWKLETKDSPISGVRGTLVIEWLLGEDGIDPAGLTVEVRNIGIYTKDFVGGAMQDAAASLRTITHPIRTATSTMLEPIPGLSDMSDAIGGGDVTMLRLMEQATTITDGEKASVSDFLERLKLLDDVTAALSGDADWLEVGSFKIAGADALTPVGTGLTPAQVQGQLDRIIDKCPVCKEGVDKLLTAVNGGATPGAGGFRFDLPVLTQPESLAGLLLGRDVDLVTFDTGRLGYDDELNIPLARFFIFAVQLAGPIEATFDLKGGVDTRGIIDALAAGSTARVANGIYLERPADGEPVVRLYSGAGLDFSAGVEVAGVSLNGGPTPDVALTVAAGSPGGKLRPNVYGNGVGCKLLEADDAKARFSVSVTATFDYLIDDYTEELASHTFLTERDLCDTSADDIAPAEPQGTLLRIRTGAERGIADGELDTVTVFMRHDRQGKPTQIVVTVNDNRTRDYAAGTFESISFTSANDDRPVLIRVLKADDIPFEKDVRIETGPGDDDILVDSSGFTQVIGGAGDDKLIVRSGGALVNAGAGDDYVAGGDHPDILGGGDGDDTIDGGGGFDALTGGDGDDILLDSSNNANCLSGGPGDDQLIDGPGSDYLNGDAAFCGPDAGRDPEASGDAGDGHDVIITGGGGDIVTGGGDRDEIRLDKTGVYKPELAIWAVGTTVFGNGGADDIRTGNGGDRIHGGPGNDKINADAGPRWDILANGAADVIYGGTGRDEIHAGEGNDRVFGDNGGGANPVFGAGAGDSCDLPITGQPAENDAVGDGDEVYGEEGDDVIALEGGADVAYGGGAPGPGPIGDLGAGTDGADVICGHAGPDEIHAGGSNDTVFGGSGEDELSGDAGADTVSGNAGQDTIDGGDGADRLIGGSTAAGMGDTTDTIDGADGSDVIIGDNGTITGTPSVPSVFDLFAGDPTLGSGDVIDGGSGTDRAFGGIGDDTMDGGDDDDHLEGNSGDDAIAGGAGEDDVVGGTSPESLPGAAANATAADAPDGGETLITGGDGRDVLIGDNGSITRPGGTDPILGGVARAVTLLDRDRTGTALAAVSGGDTIEGNGGSDRLYGQGGADYLKGNEADDFVEGNQDGDRLEGNDGEDDLIGGSSAASAPGMGDPDGADRIAGGAGADVLLGDNAVITRATTGTGTGFDWDTVANAWLGPAARRSITLLDKAAVDPYRFGSDELSGGAGADVLLGQDGNDALYGGSDDDYLEGNGGHDTAWGDAVAPSSGDTRESGQPALDGTTGPDGQDDMLGGSSLATATLRGAVTGQRDGNDELHGDGNADVQLGDNGRILRRIVNGAYLTYEAATGRPTIVRQAAAPGATATALPARFDVGAPASAGVWGRDTLYGDGGDDLQLGEDGDDTLFGGTGDDDQYGELGDDRLYGEAGEDAQVGDRGVITNRLVTTPGATFTVTAPPKISFTPFAAHPLDRRVTLSDDGDGGPVEAPGLTAGGNDLLRGGPDHDSQHGAAGDDLINGDSGGDYLFGDDGVDVMWGGQGRVCSDSSDLTCVNDPGTGDAFVDYLFGGYGRKTDPVTGGADVLDFRPRPGIDPAAWFEATSTRSTDPAGTHQHNQGIDWIYGGWDRDVMQANVADSGPNLGDRLMDWSGTYNLYLHCPAAYGGYNDVRLPTPSLQSFLERLAFSLGAGATLADLQTKGASGYRELALVYSGDVKANSGSAYPTTPGHFEDFSCAP